MKKEKLYAVGKIYFLEEKKKKVKITLANDDGSVFYAVVPRSCCNPRKWNPSDFVKIIGDVCDIEDSADGKINKIEFAKATLQRLFDEKTENEKTDFCGTFAFVGELLHIIPIDEDNYVLTLCADDGIYNIHTDRYTLFHDIPKLDLTKNFRISGVVSFTSYRRYAFEGVISQTTYVATKISFVE